MNDKIKLHDFISDEMESVSAFEISDSKRELRGIGPDEECLKKIINFINTSDDKNSISSSWTWFYGFGDKNDYSKIRFDSDLLVNIYGPDEFYGAELRENRTMANWSEAEEQILDALYN